MPKNPALEYSAAEPAFLRRLKGGNAALDGRHNVQIPRAREGAAQGGRLDMGGEEGEDDPVMLDERGDVVTKEEMEARAKEPHGKEEALVDERDEAGEAGEADQEKREAKQAEHGVSSGFGKKRKAVRVVGGDDLQSKPEVEVDEEDGPTKSLTESTEDLKDMVPQQRDDARKEATAAPAMKKGKRKKLKLSFDEAD